MKKILLSMGSILFALAALAGATSANNNSNNWNDWNPWTSHDNEMHSGVINLKVDNESYVTNDDGVLVLSTSTSWGPTSLTNKKFFNFLDLKPGDIGEDTISLHVKENKAWVCMDIKTTGTSENGQEEPEALVDSTVGVNDGELQNHLYFNFWADDGDNVYEAGETIFKSGLVKDLFNGQQWKLADASGNIWGGTSPLEPDKVKYIGKAWCFGTMTNTPKAQDGLGKQNNSSNGPLVRGTGFACSGTSPGNIVQSDGIKADITFTAVQSRNNSYVCSGGGVVNPPPGPGPTGTSTLFADNFEGYKVERFFDDKYNDPKWDVGGEDVHTHKVGGSIVANLEGGHSPATQRLITQSISTLGYKNIILKYDRLADDESGPVGAQTLTVEYSVNGGSSWTLLETVSDEAPWTTKTWALPAAANNQASLKMRFSFTGANGTNHAYIDNVSVIGVTL